MAKYPRKLLLSGALLIGLPLVFSASSFAAQPVNLRHQDLSSLSSFMSGPGVTNAISIKEVKRNTDVNKTLHVRLKETYSGYPVYGADAVVHIPHGEKTATSLTNMIAAAKSSKGFMNGTFYKDIQKDLTGSSASVFTKAQMQKATKQAVAAYQQQIGSKVTPSKEKSEAIVFVDKDNKAHWSYKLSFYVEPSKPSDMPANPVFIMDASSFQVYQQWNDIKTIDSTPDVAGGFGGNKKMGKLVYDGLETHLAKLNIMRDAETNTCSMINADVTVKNYGTQQVSTFTCEATDPEHNNLYWNGETDAVNDGYSPTNDALFSGSIIKNMYMSWYGVPALVNPDGSPMMLTMVVHAVMDNAYWDPSAATMTFGDGIWMFYPLTSLGVAAHEVSHGFTSQHSDLQYWGQSGGMNEAFSDMAAQGAEYFAYGHNSWEIGPEIFKAENEALRYMYQPSKDCNGGEPGHGCSIDTADQYTDWLDVHYSSGVYNHLFYVLGTTEGWNAKKAFDVMVYANSNYWTSTTNFVEGACGVINATKDLAQTDPSYNVSDVLNAFAAVKIDTSSC